MTADPTPVPPTLLVDPARAAELKAASHDGRSWTLTPAQLCDLELLADGTFAPLTGFLTEVEHAAVATTMRLPDGTLWPVAVDLEVDDAFAADTAVGDVVALRDPEGTMLAALRVTSIFTPPELPAGAPAGLRCLGGPVEVVQLPNQYDFVELRRTPAEAAAAGHAGGWARLLGVPTWQPLLTADLGELRRHLSSMGARLLVLALVGVPPPGAFDRFTLTRALRAAVAELPDASSLVSLVPLAVRDDPGREALLEAIVARAHGATHVWGPSDPEAARVLADHADELQVTVVPRPPDGTGPTLSSATVQRRLAAGEDVPDVVVPPTVRAELRRARPPRHARGFTLFLTGLSGSGKSTIANIVATRLQEDGARTVTLLDGDLVRQHLSSELGFSREHRDVNVLRIGWVASEITRHGGIAVCAPIAPYDAIRRRNREVIEATGGGYVLVHVATPLEVCEARDRKGLYARARAGLIPEFTGVSDPYEVPEDADLTIDTTDWTPAAAADLVLDHLRAEGWLHA